MLLTVNFLAIGLLAAISAGDDSEAADGQRRSVPPPVILPIEAEVREGERATIRITCTPRSDNSARIILRSQPEQGSIVGMRQEGRASAVVIYQHDSSKLGTEDSFTVAAQSPNSPVSGAVKVSITIRQKPPRLITPEVIDFGQSYALAEIKRSLRLKNAGGGVAAGTFEVPEPWQAPDGNSFSLTGGQSAELTLVLQPDSFRDYSGSIRFSLPGIKPTRLVASVAKPFEVTPGELTFPFREPAVSQDLTITNHTASLLKLVLVAPPWLSLPDAVEIAPGQEQKLEAKLVRQSTAALSGMVLLANGDHEQAVSVFAVPEPASIQATPPELDFGKLTAGSSGRLVLKLQNTGATDALLKLQSPEIIILGDGVTAIPLAAGSSAELIVRLQPPGIENINEELSISWDGGSLQVPVSATTVSEQISVEPAVTPAQQSPGIAVTGPESVEAPQKSSPLTTQIYAPDAFADLRDDSLPTPQSISVHDVGHDWAVLSWQQQSDTQSYLIEIRWLQRGEGKYPVIKWFEFTDAKINSEQGKYFARLQNLVPGVHFRFRISTRQPDGSLSQPQSAPLFRTLPASQASFPWMPILVIGTLILVGIVGWRRFKR